MNGCPNCLKAQTSHTHRETTAGCEQCNVRGLAISWKCTREHHFNTVRAADGEEAEKAIRRRVSDEMSRIQRLKNKE